MVICHGLKKNREKCPTGLFNIFIHVSHATGKMVGTSCPRPGPLDLGVLRRDPSLTAVEAAHAGRELSVADD